MWPTRTPLCRARFTGLGAGVSSSYTDVSSSDLPGVGASFGGGRSESLNAGINISIPIYQGGQASAQVRQRKEELGQAQIELDVARAEVRQAVTAAWTQADAAQQGYAATSQLVQAAQLALDGVLEEREVGQRTTLDVLNAQADLTSARIDRTNFDHDRILATYGVASSIGALHARQLALQVQYYDPLEHYEATRNRLGGTRTPDGRY